MKKLAIILLCSSLLAACALPGISDLLPVPTIAPTLPPASAASYTPEPTWAIEQYEQALKIMQDMALVMEHVFGAVKDSYDQGLQQFLGQEESTRKIGFAQ